jgi:multicomponent Na+:H+ antiporter subunit G
VADLVTALFLVVGGLFACIAGIGLVRMPDVYIRMHAATKAGTLGAGLTLAAAAVHSADIGVELRAVLAILFLMITAPVAAHMIGRAAYRTGVPLWKTSVVDEWANSLRRPASSPLLTTKGDRDEAVQEYPRHPV